MGKRQVFDFADRATVNLGRVEIEAPPDKVYQKLARAREWEGWLTGARLIHTAQSGALESSNTFCYTARLAPGFIDSFVADAEPNKVLNWGEKALFGLIRGECRWQLRRKGGGIGALLSKPRTVVTLNQEISGPLSFLVSNQRLESHAISWLEDLKRACEKGIGDHLRIRLEQEGKA